MKTASSSKQTHFSNVSADEPFEELFNDENLTDGMDGGEESDLVRQLANESMESR